MELTHIAKREGRLSGFLKNEMAMSTGLINRLKWQNKILVNSTPRHNDYTVQPGDVITALLDAESPQYPAEPGELTVLYEDAHILAVDKPQGMLIHPSHATMTGTLANRVLAYFQKTGQSCAFHPITRLDRDTFGIVLLAKNSHVHALLNQLQKDGQLQKTYHALVIGGPEADSGIIDAPIARRPLPSLLRYVDFGEGKPSVTRYQVLQRLEGETLLALQPVTGRTHQLRVHCAYMGFPILGDPQYGTPDLNRAGQALCAKSLDFLHPITGKPMHLESQLNVR
jgi:23S rRNA pseudouridine1911/1915/1917 synthase